MAPGLEVLVLGGTGIIGEEVVKASLRRGYQVTSLSRNPPTRGPANAHNVQYVPFKFEGGSELPLEVSRRTFDAVIDLLSLDSKQVASLVGQFQAFTTQYVFVSSATIFDKPPSGKLTTENTSRIAGGWPYPLRKIQAERALREMLSTRSASFTIARPYITYSHKRLPFGYWESDVMVPRLRAGATIPIAVELAEVGTTLTDARDVGESIAGLIANDAALDNDVNVVSDRWLTWGDAIQIIAQASGSQSRLEFLPHARLLKDFPELRGKSQDRLIERVFDVSKLRRILPAFDFVHTFNTVDVSTLLQEMPLQRGSAVAQGRLDRLLRVDSSWSIRSSGIDALKYQIGRQRALWALGRAVKSRASRKRARDYGVI